MLKPHRRPEVGFELRNEIGQHVQGSRTFIARDPQLNADIVIKEMAKASLDVDRYFGEAQALYASSHPNVVQIHYACDDNASVYIAMPF